ncbi:alpha-L-fucosidase [Streptomyces sp. FIT100]|uniref:alpha-L-fucosidase n=1 Tax=Streptomyces sp. FIT100 TaxID=2837956 RepID=UPI0021C9A3D4|nr:alpha-L-fucosidase [Streptomyces sp. FIT100]UUN30917.1 alpha-L-fucosidase [Streptomyces sp. FIT100]
MTTQSWFAEARLGIFVHWGISSVRGVALSRSSVSGEIAYQEYMEQLGGFTAARYNADAWAELFARAGAKYAVLTARQHDGVALWDTATTELSVVRATPAGRDLIRPFARALRRRGLRVGVYFSYLDRGQRSAAAVGPARLGPPADAGARRRQVRELVGNYRPDLLWFDGAGGHGHERWRAEELPGLVPVLGPETVVIGGSGGDGVHDAPELGIPVIPSDGPWELCYPLDDAQGHTSPAGQQSVGELIHVFAETVSGGGNLLLKTSPREDGTILPGHADRLTGLGRWIRRNRDAVYATTGLPYGYFEGPSTLSQDRRTLFLFCTRAPWHLIELRGLRNAVRRVSVLSTGAEVPYHVVGGLPDWNIPRVIRIKPPASPGVLVLELDGELELHQDTWMTE